MTVSKVLWFSRHEMTDAQFLALTNKLGNIAVTQVNASPANVHVPFTGDVNGVSTDIESVKSMIRDFDVLAIVAPIGLQQQFLSIAGEKPVIVAQNTRILEKDKDGGEDKVVFTFGGWKRIMKIDIIMTDF